MIFGSLHVILGDEMLAFNEFGQPAAVSQGWSGGLMCADGISSIFAVRNGSLSRVSRSPEPTQAITETGVWDDVVAMAAVSEAGNSSEQTESTVFLVCEAGLYCLTWKSSGNLVQSARPDPLLKTEDHPWIGSVVGLTADSTSLFVATHDSALIGDSQSRLYKLDRQTNAVSILSETTEKVTGVTALPLEHCEGYVNPRSDFLKMFLKSKLLGPKRAMGVMDVQDLLREISESPADGAQDSEQTLSSKAQEMLDLAEALVLQEMAEVAEKVKEIAGVLEQLKGGLSGEAKDEALKQAKSTAEEVVEMLKGKSDIERIWEKYDRDGNGRLDFSEIAAFYRDVFAFNDTSQSASVLARVAARTAQMMDKDGNGYVDKVEFMDYLEGRTLITKEPAPTIANAETTAQVMNSPGPKLFGFAKSLWAVDQTGGFFCVDSGWRNTVSAAVGENGVCAVSSKGNIWHISDRGCELMWAKSDAKAVSAYGDKFLVLEGGELLIMEDTQRLAGKEACSSLATGFETAALICVDSGRQEQVIGETQRRVYLATVQGIRGLLDEIFVVDDKGAQVLLVNSTITESWGKPQVQVSCSRLLVDRAAGHDVHGQRSLCIHKRWRFCGPGHR